MSNEERDREILAMRSTGMTLEAIAVHAGITRERVRQIIKENGGVTAEQSRAVENHRQSEERDRLVADVEVAVRNGRCTSYEEIEAVFGLAPAAARQATNKLTKSLLASRDFQRRWTDEVIVEAIRRAATYAYPLSRKAYQAVVDSGEVDGPSAARVDQVMGWSQACERAGVECPPAPRDSYQSKWTDADIWHYVSAYLSARGPGASFYGYDAWRAAERPDAPSSATMRNRLGRWNDVRRAALLAEGSQGRPS